MADAERILMRESDSEATTKRTKENPLLKPSPTSSPPSSPSSLASKVLFFGGLKTSSSKQYLLHHHQHYNQSYHPPHHPQHHRGNDQLGDYLCGFGAAIVNILVTFPINKIIFRQMLHGHSVSSAFGELRAEGARHLYRGVGPPLIQRSVTLSLMFGTFGSYQYLLERYGNEELTGGPYGRLCLAAFLAGSTEAFLCPFERIQMLLQDDRKHHLYKNTVDAFKKVRVYGLREYYRGISAILLRNGPSNILFFSFRDELKVHLPSLSSSSTTSSTSESSSSSSDNLFSELLRDFISGSIIGALISTVFYPLNVLRTQMQTQPAGSRHISLLAAFRAVYEQRDGRLRALYRGVHVNYSRSFLSWGIINACYNLFQRMRASEEGNEEENFEG